LSGIKALKVVLCIAPQVTVWSCRIASESFGQLSIALLLLSPRAKTTEHLAGFFLLADRQGALADWLAWAEPDKHRTQIHPCEKCEQRWLSDC